MSSAKARTTALRGTRLQTGLSVRAATLVEQLRGTWVSPLCQFCGDADFLYDPVALVALNDLFGLPEDAEVMGLDEEACSTC